MIQPFIDALYAIAIGLGFTEFPENPLTNKPAVLFFGFTLVLAALDWYYYRGFESTVPSERRFLYYSLQVVTVLVLSQMFRHSHADVVKPWLAYFIVLNLLGVAWDLLANVQNAAAFVSINGLFIVVSALGLFFYDKLDGTSPFGIDLRYTVFGAEMLVILAAIPILRIFNR